MRALPFVCMVLWLLPLSTTEHNIILDATHEHAAHGISSSLPSALASRGLHQPNELAAILLDLGLSSIHSLRILNVAEQLELAESLKDAGMNLGTRSLLRHLATTDADVGTEVFTTEHNGEPERAEHKAQRHNSQNTEGNSPGSHEGRLLQTSGGGGFSIEVAAIVFTGIIGMIGYVVQARSTQKASGAQVSLEREAVEAEKARARAAKQLERVQLQMEEFIGGWEPQCYLLHNYGM